MGRMGSIATARVLGRRHAAHGTKGAAATVSGRAPRSPAPSLRVAPRLPHPSTLPYTLDAQPKRYRKISGPQHIFLALPRHCISTSLTRLPPFLHYPFMSADNSPPPRGSPYLSPDPQLPPHLNTISPGSRPAAAYPAKKLSPGSGRSSRNSSRRGSPRLGGISLSRTHSREPDLESGIGSSSSTPNINGGHDSIRKFETGEGSRSRCSEIRHSTALLQASYVLCTLEMMRT